MIQDV
jgi:L-ascorbate peroxidase